MKGLNVIMMFGMLFLPHVTLAAQEFGRATGCIVEPEPKWRISTGPQSLGCGNVDFRAEPKIPPLSDLEPQMKHMPVEDQKTLGLCALFAGITCAEFVTSKRFSVYELAIRAAARGEKINQGYHSHKVLPYVVSGLIPKERGIPYEEFDRWASTDVVKVDYHTTIEEAKRRCCPRESSGKILPTWLIEDDYVFGDEVIPVKIPKPIGFWRELKLNLFRLCPHDIGRLKEILQHVPIYIGMDTLQEYDQSLKKLKGENWWQSINDKRGNEATIREYQGHHRKMDLGELVITNGHAVCLCGYNDNIRAFKFRNSWGVTYANNGYGYISYNLFKERYDAPCYWRLDKGNKLPTQHPTETETTIKAPVYGAYVILPHPTEQYSPDKSRIIKKDEGEDRIKLDKMLKTFAASR